MRPTWARPETITAFASLISAGSHSRSTAGTTDHLFPSSKDSSTRARWKPLPSPSRYKLPTGPRPTFCGGYCNVWRRPRRPCGNFPFTLELPVQHGAGTPAATRTSILQTSPTCSASRSSACSGSSTSAACAPRTTMRFAPSPTPSPTSSSSVLPPRR